MFAQESLLRNIIMLIVEGPGAASMTYWFLSTAPGKAVQAWLLRALVWTNIGSSELGRYVSIATASLVSLSFYLIAGAFEWVVFPATVEGWGNLVLALMGFSYAGSQVLHGMRDLRARDRLRG